MTNKLAKRGLELAKKGLLFQAVTALFVTAFAAAAGGSHSAMSAAAGALISILPNGVFMAFAFRYAGASKNDLVARSFSQGSKLKLALTIILFVIAFKGLNAAPLEIFMAFVITTASHGLAMFHYGTKE
ncbi:ATP synthase subunit I [Alteromonas abrolhosensis]|uniref:ATP synthase subunit I n=1 Tax=Alteromonas abrolhosensis TaxID=1892904 RepID=UPI00351885FB